MSHWRRMQAITRAARRPDIWRERVRMRPLAERGAQVARTVAGCAVWRASHGTNRAGRQHGERVVNWHCMRSAKCEVRRSALSAFSCWYPMQERWLAMAEVRCKAGKPMLAMNSCGISSRSLSWVQSCECRSHQCCVKQGRVGTGRDGRWRTFMGWCGLCSVSGAIAMHGECSLQL